MLGGKGTVWEEARPSNGQGKEGQRTTPDAPMLRGTSRQAGGQGAQALRRPRAAGRQVHFTVCVFSTAAAT